MGFDPASLTLQRKAQTTTLPLRRYPGPSPGLLLKLSCYPYFLDKMDGELCSVEASTQFGVGARLRTGPPCQSSIQLTEPPVLQLVLWLPALRVFLLVAEGPTPKGMHLGLKHGRIVIVILLQLAVPISHGFLAGDIFVTYPHMLPDGCMGTAMCLPSQCIADYACSICACILHPRCRGKCQKCPGMWLESCHLGALRELAFCP